MNRDELSRIFKNPPHLYTERTCLRKMMKSDSHDMYEYARQEAVTRYLLWDPHPSESYTYKYLAYLQSRYRAGDFYDWAIVLKDTYKMIGTCGFTCFHIESNSAEVGYVLNPDYWGKGLATEVVRKIVEFGFNELRLNRIEARYMIGNDKSRHVMEKVGMTYEGTNRESMHVKGEYVSIGVCAILKNDFYK